MLNKIFLITRIGVVFSGLLTKKGKYQVTRTTRIAGRTLFFSMMYALSACSGSSDDSSSSPAVVVSPSDDSSSPAVVVPPSDDSSSPAVVVPIVPIDGTVLFTKAQPTLSAIAGDSKIKLNWGAVLTSASYTLCHATASLGDPADLDNCAVYPSGTLVQNLDTSVVGTGDTVKSHTLTDLVNDTIYYFALVAIDSDGNKSLPSSPVSATPISFSPMLNDTGITFGGDLSSGNNTDCTGVTIAQQDCSIGRDVSHNDDSDGHGGFSFTKLDSAGTALAASASVWSCVQDNVTGLTWEVKTAVAGGIGLHDANDTYSWYSTDEDTNGGSAGFADEYAHLCEGHVAGDTDTYCNTEAFTARVNAAGLCGASDWRLPTITELRSIVDYGTVTAGRVIDTVYFPNTRSANYWSSSPDADVADNSNYAWLVNFSYGNNFLSYGSLDYNVRLVSSGE